MGGHSGAEIDKNRANANSLLGKFLHGLDEKTDFELISVQGGQKDNAITRRLQQKSLFLKKMQMLSENMRLLCREHGEKSMQELMRVSQ